MSAYARTTQFVLTLTYPLRVSIITATECFNLVVVRVGRSLRFGPIMIQMVHSLCTAPCDPCFASHGTSPRIGVCMREHGVVNDKERVCDKAF